MILEVGKIYSGVELAQWFGIAYSTFRNNKKKKMIELQDYAKFEVIKTKIKILEVYQGVYCGPKKNGKKFIHENFYIYWPEGKISTSKIVSAEMYEACQEDVVVKEDTFYKYFLDEKVLRRGSSRKHTSGVDGGHKNIWCYYDEQKDKLVPLSEEQLQILTEYKRKYCEPYNDEMLTFEQLKEQSSFTKEGEDEEEKYLKEKRRQAFLNFKRAINNRLGVRVLVGTIWID